MLHVNFEFRASLGNRVQGREAFKERILETEANVFLCVSSFNQAARHFYKKHGYKQVGELDNFIVSEASEIILRKTVCPKVNLLGKQPESKLLEDMWIQ